MSRDYSQRHQIFHQLHQQGCFVLPNPWNIGSAKYLESMGFKALATTSSGFAFSQGKNDGAVDVYQVIEHCRQLVEATSVPINADFEDGHADMLTGLEDNVRQCAQTGVSGISIEDATGNPQQPLYTLEEAVERIHAARAGINQVDPNIKLIGRAECFIIGQPDLDETIRRLQAYAAAGADILYAPALATAEQIKAVVEAVAPKPVNVLMGPASHLGFAQLADLGVRRISTGGALSLQAWSAFSQAAQQLLDADIQLPPLSVTHPQLGQLFS